MHVSSCALQLSLTLVVAVTTCWAILQNQNEHLSGVRWKRQVGASSRAMSSEDSLLASTVTAPLSTPAYSSASPTAPMPATEPTTAATEPMTPVTEPTTPVTEPESSSLGNCSIGQLVSLLDESDKLNESGTYLFPNAISCNGYLESVNSCFFYNDEGSSNITNFRMRIGVFRQMGDNYGSEHWIDFDVTRASRTETQRCEVMDVIGRPSVLQGDRIAVQVMNGCSQSTCPLQPNLRAAPSVSVFFTRSLVDTIPASQIMATASYTNVHLNVRARIDVSSGYASPSPSPTRTAERDQATIIGGAVGATVAVLILSSAVVGASILVVLKKCKKKKVAMEADLQELTEKQIVTDPKHTNKYTTISTVHGSTELDSTPADLTTSSTVSELLHLLPQNLVIQGSRIKLLKSIGEGAFGIVYKAHYSRHEGSAVETVAVKSLKAIFTSGDLRNLVKEIQLMQFFDNSNVMPLLGVCLDAGCPEAESAPCLVMPYMANGSLLTYLRKAKKVVVLPKDATSKRVEQVQTKLLKICYEIALGMKYLAEQKFVHRDLSARNCMMGNDGTIKVSDFGLAEDIYTKNYFRVDTSVPIAVPFKWMPLESLEEGVYNEKTDMWSFGITSWEIFTGGKIPYTAMSVRDVLQLLKSGGRLDKPENAACSEDVYTMMLDCWDDDPEKRPRFIQVAATLSNMLQTVSGYLNLDQLHVEESLPPLLPTADLTDTPSPMKEAPPSPSSPDET